MNNKMKNNSSQENSNTKNYVLDTNILLSYPNSIYGFQDNHVWVTATTLQELDKKKNIYNGEVGYNAREVIRILDDLRKKGDLLKGVSLPNGGVFYVAALNRCKLPDLSIPEEFNLSNPDNCIMATVIQKQYENKNPFILVTNDISMRVNANICGIVVESYRNDHIKSEKLYTGKMTLETDLNIINELYKNKSYDIEIPAYENEFFVLKNGQQSALTIYRDNSFRLIGNKQKIMSVQPKNASQSFALYALTAPADEIPFVILQGAAGTAKTFLSLAAGLSAVNNEEYNKLLITRNNITSDSDFGYLPGDINDKMEPLLAPFFDNLEILLRGDSKESNEEIKTQIEDLFESGTISVYPLAYMRGRSISDSYIIIDEAQNSTRSQMRDIITRAGKGTKIVICGDLAQIDNHTLDQYNNGLIFAADRMKGSKLCAQIFFDENESVRSQLATEALKRLAL